MRFYKSLRVAKDYLKIDLKQICNPHCKYYLPWNFGLLNLLAFAHEDFYSKQSGPEFKVLNILHHLQRCEEEKLSLGKLRVFTSILLQSVGLVVRAQVDFMQKAVFCYQRKPSIINA